MTRRNFELTLFVLPAVLAFLTLPAWAINSTGAKISQVKIYDQGTIDSASLAIDTSQITCPGSSELEKFDDTLLGLTIKNNYLSALRVERFWYSVKNADGAGSSITSTKLAPVGTFEIPARTTNEVLVVFLHSGSGVKTFTGSSSSIPDGLGFRNVTLRIRARVGHGKIVNLSATSAMSFSSISRCS